MSSAFSSDFKEQVRAKTDLAELVGETVALTPQRGGLDYLGLCPFHDDHKPSFHVYPDRQSYRCWACEEGGDCFSFVMKIEGVGFREALEMLARRVNLEMPRGQQQRYTGEPNRKTELHDVLTWAETQFHRCLIQGDAGARARDYLASRGFTRQTIEEYRLGCHPGGWDWLINGARGVFTPAQLYEARLVRERQSTGQSGTTGSGGNGYYDDFRDRVLFPIRDARGRCVAFGGRVLPGEQNADAPKYLNSADSEVFSKSRILFNFDKARHAIRKADAAVVMEGYTDCIAAWEAGVTNVVATLGVALTETHVTNLKRFARRVVLVFDGDTAGQLAADRALEKFIGYEIDLRVLTLPAGQDPADFLENQGCDAFGRLVENAPEAWDHKLQTCLSRNGLESLDARHRVLDEMLTLAASAGQLEGTEREDILLGTLAHRTGAPVRTVRGRLAELRTQASRTRAQQEEWAAARANSEAAEHGAHELPGPHNPQSPQSGAVANGSPDDVLEWELLEILFARPAAVGYVRERVGVDGFTNGKLRRILQMCFDLHEEGLEPSADGVLLAFDDPELKRTTLTIDESARKKNVAGKIDEDGAAFVTCENEFNEDATTDPAERPTVIPRYVEQVVSGLRWRTERQSHEASKGKLAGRRDSASRLDDQSIAILERMTRFHQRRAT